MKSTPFLSCLFAFCLVLLASVVSVASDNVLLGVASMPVASYVVQKATGVQLIDARSAAFATLLPIPRTQQGITNPGGGRRLFLIPSDNFTAEWPKKADITAGEVTVAPTLIAGPPAPVFTEVQVSDNSLKLDEALKGASGYQSWEQSLEVKVAGFGKEQVAAMEKLINTELVAVVVMNDGGRVVVGNSFLGLQFEVMHTSGAKGSDRREWTLKAKQDGYMSGYLPIGSTVAIPGATAV